LTALELYAEAFQAAGALDRLEAFASLRGAAFHGLAPNRGTVTLVREGWTVPERLPFGDAELKPLRAGEWLGWRALDA
jgi:dihydroorotase